MLRIFISYSRENRPIVESLVNDLNGLGHNVWIDEKLKGGQGWWNEILSQIRKCDLFVFSLSKEIEKSHACGLELKYAEDLGKRILPILIGDNVSIDRFPKSISQTQYVDYRKNDKDATIKLINALQNLSPAPSLPDSLPIPPEVPISYIYELKNKILESASLSFSEQAELVTKLKHRIKDAKESNEQADIRYLLLELKKRDDLYAKVGSDIDDVLHKLPVQGIDKSTISPPPTATKPPPSTQGNRPAAAPLGTQATPRSNKGRNILVLVVAAIIVFVCFCIFLSILPCFGPYGC
ncbi:MAG TPA: TIR domain-containing protein [Anaerolineales bacterium]|nr:TIR domain-containing protein [Anaerolineales bacterium]